MKVYAVMKQVDYEGCNLLAVFASREEAVAFARSSEWFDSYADTSVGVAECELGEPVDFYGIVEWVE